ncbi:hypothetical protein LDL59_16735 [Kaistella anthropi]|nr:hypothetical protein [Kaistella anthropi]
MQIQKSEEGRSLRMEAFYKNYTDLIKTRYQNYRQLAINNNGDGFAKGIEMFWRDKKTIKNIDYWVSYSFLDSKRNFQEYDQSLFPNFASKHTLSLVAKKFVTNWKTGFNLSYSYASGRPFYNFLTDNDGNYHLQQQGKAKDYNALNFSVNNLMVWGKKTPNILPFWCWRLIIFLGKKHLWIPIFQ